LKTLCIDIGGTRIKSAILSDNPTLQELSKAPSFIMPSVGWRNHSMPSLLDLKHPYSVAAHYQTHGFEYDRVAIAGPGKISSSGHVFAPHLDNSGAKVPKDLRKAFEQICGLPVSLTDDSSAWLLGSQAYLEMQNSSIEYPAISIALGTGIAISMALSPDKFEYLDICKFPTRTWKNLGKVAKFKIKKRGQIHHLLGTNFFNYANNKQLNWDHSFLRKHYTERVKVTLQDLIPKSENILGDSIKSIILCGGNSFYISTDSLKIRDINIINISDQPIGPRSHFVGLLGIKIYSDLYG